MYEYFPVHAYAMAGEVDSYLREQEGFPQKREEHCRPWYTLHPDNTR
jgi:hypothetical protein